METVYIAGGCLWGVQHFFDKSLQFDQAIQVVGHMAQRVDSQMK